MKTSLILIAAIFLNTTLLLSEPISFLVKDINPWVFVTMESILLLGYFLNQWIKKFKQDCALHLGDLNLFVLDGPKGKS